MPTVLPNRAGAGFKLQHAQAILEGEPDVGWFEVHPETYMVPGGLRHRILGALRARYPLSLHGVALSLGGADPLDAAHLAALRGLVERYAPASISEHLAWSAHGELYFGDLLPVPLTDGVLERVAANVERTQTALGRTILVENPSHYLRPAGDALAEVEFLTALARRTGCGLLVDLDNVVVSAGNVGYDAEAYVDALPGDVVGEIHLGGHEVDAVEPDLLVDTHSRPVPADVWTLLRRLVGRIGARPTLVEWDNDVPAWDVLHLEVQKAEFCLAAHGDARLP